ncbi:MAG: pro-sigmaK processing inhibitor BofA family protein [Anaerovibrio sp.]|uniref:pro-sigmaK processing inhibitor BofA family protein n=1 Tax=uncultured Anaerovibrio sp. TaxID=361586 RepID=UPI0025DC268E|nr:pro-sigmaK processing inhibitor BofA family protein [uncultured Anaerovibrio sp.]MBQ3855024.1 pro-sigmaK processing inhibitor BofA family protein [Anaerovibrio sp.]
MEILIGFIVLAIAIYIIGKLISIPFKILKNIVIGLIVGSAAIWVVDLFGMGIEINVVNALIASVVVYIISSII